jgi:hypothetical protein
VFQIKVIYLNAMFGSCHHGIVCPQIGDGGDNFQIWTMAANILNKQSQRADKEWSSSLGVGQGANMIPPHKKWVNAEKTEYLFMSCHQNSGQNPNLMAGNKFF